MSRKVLFLVNGGFMQGVGFKNTKKFQVLIVLMVALLLCFGTASTAAAETRATAGTGRASHGAKKAPAVDAVDIFGSNSAEGEILPVAPESEVEETEDPGTGSESPTQVAPENLSRSDRAPATSSPSDALKAQFLDNLDRAIGNAEIVPGSASGTKRTSDGKLVVPSDIEQPKVSAEAPDSFRCMTIANQQGDRATAERCADMFAKYMINLMFQVRELTQMIGEAMVRNGMMEEESWVGASQFIDRELAMARKEEKSPFTITDKIALQRIKPDPSQKAEVYFFFSPSNRWSREMAPDVERLWQIVKRDPRLSLKVVSVNHVDKFWIKSFQDYTGLTAPIMDGTAAVKKLRIGFVPMLMVVSPSNQKGYTRTGFQSFERMYQFVRTVQGLDATFTEDLVEFAKKPIGEIEKSAKLLWENREQAGALSVKTADRTKVGTF